MANEEVMKNEEVNTTEAVEETEEYDTFFVELSGVTREWAIIEEFKYTYKDVEKNYLICAEVVGDEITDEGLYIFEGRTTEEELEVKNVDTEEEYTAVAEAYCNLGEEEAE